MDLIYDNYSEYCIEDSLYFLRMFSKYDSNCASIIHQFTYECEKSKNLLHIRQSLEIDKIMGDRNEIERILQLLKWSKSYLKFSGKVLQSRRYDDCDFFELTIKARNEGYSLNCRYISLLFTQILLAAGFKARWVVCLPMALEYRECHCVTEVFIEMCNKWIIVDASFNLVYFDKKGNLLNLLEMRNIIIKGEKFRVINTPNHFDELWDCWTSHIFRFKYLLNSGYNMHLSKNKIYAFLNPINYIIKDKTIKHTELDVTKLVNLYNNSFFY